MRPSSKINRIIVTDCGTVVTLLNTIMIQGNDPSISVLDTKAGLTSAKVTIHRTYGPKPSPEQLDAIR